MPERDIQLTLPSPAVEIAVPTHNCAPWLDEFLESLLRQDLSGWQLIVRDDLSTDATVQCLAKWQTRIGQRLRALPDSGTGNLGLIENYNAVLSATSTRWVMTAGPDDVWLPGRMSYTLAAMRRAEDAFGPHTPIAICTDAQVIDSDGRTIAPSFWNWSRMQPSWMRDVRRVAMESIALGSTMLINRALLDLALPIPATAAYQDWWLALVAATFGRVVALPERTILYRRHAANQTTNPYGNSLTGAIRRTMAVPTAPRQRLLSLLV